MKRDAELRCTATLLLVGALTCFGAATCTDSSVRSSKVSFGDTGSDSDGDGDTDADGDVDGDSDPEKDTDDSDDTDGEPAPADAQRYTIWCDPDTGLCWQDPQRKAYDYKDIGVVAKDAVEYCKDLVLGGYDDWRLPTIDELRTIVAGSPDCEEGGACPVASGAEKMDGWDLACIGSKMWKGPGENGCYWKKGLTGSCDKEDPFSADHHLETWAKDPAKDDKRWIASVLFEIGGLAYNHVCSYGDVRCVRDGPSPPERCDGSEECTPGEARKCPCKGYKQPDGVQVCAAKGDCFSPCDCVEHTQNPEVTPECENDVCPKSDKIELTIKVPGELDSAPHQVLAFFYDAKSFSFPPVGPPDGGTHYNQIVDPGMPPYNMTIPGCTYYGEYLLEGDYQLFVLVQQEAKFPPIPECGDYMWGDGAEPVSFPFKGEKHGGDTVKMEVTVNPVCGCPAGEPHECEGGYCVAKAADCCPAPTIYLCEDGQTCVEDFSDCPFCAGTEPIPDDSEVFSCRYASIYVAKNCADLPVCEGWATEDEVFNFCAGLDGARKNTLKVTKGNSCLVEKAMGQSSVRCLMKGANKSFWAYGAPNNICKRFMGGTPETGPFCDGYCGP